MFFSRNFGRRNSLTRVGLKVEPGYATVIRNLQVLVSENLFITSGNGKGTKYQISQAYELLYPIDTAEYFKKGISFLAKNNLEPPHPV